MVRIAAFSSFSSSSSSSSKLSCGIHFEASCSLSPSLSRLHFYNHQHHHYSAPSGGLHIETSLVGIDDLNFRFLAHVLCVIEMGVASSSSSPCFAESRIPSTEEGVALPVVHKMRLTQQNNLGIRLGLTFFFIWFFN